MLSYNVTSSKLVQPEKVDDSEVVPHGTSILVNEVQFEKTAPREVTKIGIFIEEILLQF
jgi:hypothetical protein